ncbi:MAG: metal ABC transporter substrate-binding protein [Chloroflexi bacterium]|nr:metal ABC transporter substrate-binding protein [Chloroflexota bacterium]
MKRLITITLASWLLLSTACQPVQQQAESGGLQILAAETFLAEIAQDVAGERATVQALIPAGVDPHGFEPTPRDAARLAEAQVVIINGGGLETWLQRLLENAAGEHVLIEASAGLAPREAHVEASLPEACQAGAAHDDEHESDPHFWLAPNLVIRYVENIRDGLIQADPAGEEAYRSNAAAFTRQLEELDAWIMQQTAQIPAERRLLVTSHESFGYFADRYGFVVAGTILPSVSSVAAPSAQDLARLTECVRASGAPAVFLETGGSQSLALQLSDETGVKVVTDLHTHSLPEGNGGYIEMMRHNAEVIVAALR